MKRQVYSSDEKAEYLYSGIALYHGQEYGPFKLTTQAVSKKKAVSNFKFQIAKKLGLNTAEVGSIFIDENQVLIGWIPGYQYKLEEPFTI